MRREIPILITAFVGLFMILSFFIPHPIISGIAATLKEWFMLIAAFAIVLGIGNLIRVNMRRIRRKGPDWGYKIVTLAALAAFAIIGLVLDRDLEIRDNWLTRGMGLAAPDRVEVIQGRQRLLDHRAGAAAILDEAAGDEEIAAKSLAKELGLEIDTQAPEIFALGADGVRALTASAVHEELLAARGTGASKRRRLAIEGKLLVTGYGPVVAAILRENEDADKTRYALMVTLSFSRDQADDLVALGPEGVVALSPEKVANDLREAAAEKKERLGSIHNPAAWIFKFIFVPLQATMFSLLAFFIASAAFRAFRMRTTEAALLLVAGLLVIVGRVPLGQFDWGIAQGDFGFHIITQWIMNVPNTAAMRGILMGAAMGVIVMGLKVILGIERSYMGGD